MWDEGTMIHHTTVHTNNSIIRGDAGVTGDPDRSTPAAVHRTPPANATAHTSSKTTSAPRFAPATCRSCSLVPRRARRPPQAPQLGSSHPGREFPSSTSSSPTTTTLQSQVPSPRLSTPNLPTSGSPLPLVHPVSTPRSSPTSSVSCSNEHGTIYAISSDFGDRMTTQSNGLIVLLSEHF